MKQISSIAAVTLLTGMMIFCAYSFLPREDRMQSFQWLLGSWESQRKAGMMVERWRQLNDSSFAGSSMLNKPGGNAELLEEIELVYRNNQYFFIAAASGQNGGDKVSFQISWFSDSGFLAENPQHDFPRRIRYQLIGKDSILATIDAGAANPQEKVDFSFRRQR